MTRSYGKDETHLEQKLRSGRIVFVDWAHPGLGFFVILVTAVIGPLCKNCAEAGKIQIYLYVVYRGRGLRASMSALYTRVAIF